MVKVILRYQVLAAMLLFTSGGGAYSQVVIAKVEHAGAYLGVYLQDLNDEVREELGTKQRRGAAILQVVDDSPAQKAGLQEDDIVIAADGRTVRDSEDLRNIISKKNTGDELELRVVRSGEQLEIVATLEQRPEDSAVELQLLEPEGNIFSVIKPRAQMGVQLQDLSSSLAEYFNTKEHGGVLVTDVEENSAAEEAKLEAGDVILSIDGNKTETVADVYEILDDKRAEEEVTITYLRKGREERTEVTLDKSSGLHIFSGRGGQPFRWRSLPELRAELRLPGKDDIRVYLDEDIEKLRDRLGDIKIMRDEDIEELRAEIQKLKDELKELKNKIK